MISVALLSEMLTSVVVVVYNHNRLCCREERGLASMIRANAQGHESAYALTSEAEARNSEQHEHVRMPSLHIRSVRFCVKDGDNLSAECR